MDSTTGIGEDERPQFAQPPARPEPSTVEQALAELDEDEEVLLTAVDDAKKAMALSEGPDGSGSCRRVCSALGSMQRSAAAVCRLAGAEDPRCDRARSVVERSETRVRDAGCGCEEP